MDALALHIGDDVIHPRYGFGTIESILAHDRDGNAVEYYGVRLSEGGVLSVPVDAASALGLRRLVNGVAALLAILNATATPLPEHARHRAQELSARWTSPEPVALATGVRDLLGHARRFGLKGVEQQWLKRACDRLGSEAARVDGVSTASARSAIIREVTRLKEPPPDLVAPAKPAAQRKRRS